MELIKGKRILIRSLKKNGAPVIYNNLKAKIYYRMGGIPCYTSIDQAYPYIEKTQLLRRQGTDHSCGIADSSTNKLIGMVGIHNFTNPHKNAEKGYWIAKEYWGKGIAMEAVKLAIKFAFNAMKLRRIYAYIFPHNIASMTILEKNGFTQEGILRKHFKLGNKYVDCIVFGILKEEFRENIQ